MNLNPFPPDGDDYSTGQTLFWFLANIFIIFFLVIEVAFSVR